MVRFSTVKELSKYMAENKMPYSIEKFDRDNNRWKLICEFHHGPFMVFEDNHEPGLINYIENALKENARTINLVDSIGLVKRWWNAIKD